MDVFKISVPNGIEVGTFDNTRSLPQKNDSEETPALNLWGNELGPEYVAYTMRQRFSTWNI